MIRSIDIRNFRCFGRLKIEDCARLNVIVGDNGAGKTALLESVFLALGCTTELGLRFRQQRGLDGAFQGQASKIEAALWGGYFTDNDMSQTISITLEGDGAESRSLSISRDSTQETLYRQVDTSIDALESSLKLTWRDHTGQILSVSPRISDKGLTFPSTGEELNSFYYFAANQNVGSVDTASRYSELSQSNKHRRFIELFSKEYDWITDLNVEVYGGSPVLFATIRGENRKLPLPNVSTGINRAVGILLAIASAKDGVILIDEIENGIHYSHLAGIWRVLLAFAEEYDCQIFVTTHSQECLMALSKAVGKSMSNVSLWQVERRSGDNAVTQFTGDDLTLALEYHEEVR